MPKKGRNSRLSVLRPAGLSAGFASSHFDRLIWVSWEVRKGVVGGEEELLTSRSRAVVVVVMKG